MKYINYFFMILLLILLLGILILIIDYLRINIFYKINENMYKEEFLVQGNKNGYIPQGLTYSDKYEIYIQTSYNKKHSNSKIYITDKNYKFIKELELVNNNSHVGGITNNNDLVFITSDYKVFIYNLKDIVNSKNKIEYIDSYELPVRGDFSYYKNNILWIGDFFLNPFYPVPNNNPLLMGYDINNLDYNKPSYVISLPKMVQGMEIDENNRFIFTSSFTYLINSKLSIYKNVLKEKNEYYELNNNKIPYYKFNKNNLVKTITLPPMAEGIVYKDDKLYILFESSSSSYSIAYPRLDHVLSIKKQELK